MTDDAADNDLLQRATAGDQTALVALLERHGPRVERLLTPKIASKWRGVLSAQDVMQVTYLEVFLHIHEFQPRGDGAFQAWLRRIAENNLRDAVRDLGRKKRPQPEMRIGASTATSPRSLCSISSGSRTPRPVSSPVSARRRERWTRP